jgi:hypothetical protein
MFENIRMIPAETVPNGGKKIKEKNGGGEFN